MLSLGTSFQAKRQRSGNEDQSRNVSGMFCCDSRRITNRFSGSRAVMDILSCFVILSLLHSLASLALSRFLIFSLIRSLFRTLTIILPQFPTSTLVRAHVLNDPQNWFHGQFSPDKRTRSEAKNNASNLLPRS